MKDINLLPEEIKSTSSYTPTKSKSGFSIKAVIITIFVLIVIGVSILLPKAYIQTLKLELSGLEKDINDPKYSEVKKVNSELATIDGVLASKADVMDSIDSMRFPVNEIIVSVNSVVPQGCEINSIKYSGKNLFIAGQAENRTIAAELVARISRLNFFTITQDIKLQPDGKFELVMESGAATGGEAK